MLRKSVNHVSSMRFHMVETGFKQLRNIHLNGEGLRYQSKSGYITKVVII
jgi:hypothetical protein